MCKSPKPAPMLPPPPPRAQARAPMRVRDSTPASLRIGAGAQRATIVNPRGNVPTANRASLGGNPVVLGG